MGRTVSNDPTQRFRFKIEIGTVEFGASTVSGLEKEIEVGEYREGGYTSTHKLPGIATTGTLTIEKGAFATREMYDRVVASLKDESFREDVIVVEMNRNGTPKRQWRATEAWASKITAPEFDATSSEIAMESMELQYEDLELEVL